MTSPLITRAEQHQYQQLFIHGAMIRTCGWPSAW